MNRRTFLGLGGSFVAWALMPTLPAGGAEVYVTRPLDAEQLIRTIEWKNAPGYVFGDLRFPYAGIWQTPMLNVKLRPGYEPAWFHREGPFGLYQSSTGGRKPEARHDLERAIRLLARRYDEMVHTPSLPVKLSHHVSTSLEPALYAGVDGTPSPDLPGWWRSRPANRI